MKATRFCLSVVKKGMTTAKPTLGPDVAEISDFLVSHVDDLRQRAASGNAPNSVFLSSDHAAIFEALSSGSEDDFLAAAQRLAISLVNEMSHVNPKEGVLVCATFEDNNQQTLAAALKLQVVSDHGAVLEQLATGETVLSAIEHVLDRPGELQKGLVYPDDRLGSAAVVGDKLKRDEARYFLVAMGVQAEEHAKRALGAVASALVRSVEPADRPKVLEQLVAADPGPVDSVVAEATQGVSLSLPVNEIVDSLDQMSRPVRSVNTRVPLKATIVSGSITIRLNSADLSRVDWEPDPGGGWIITIRADEEPEVRHQS